MNLTPTSVSSRPILQASSQRIGQTGQEKARGAVTSSPQRARPETLLSLLYAGRALHWEGKALRPRREAGKQHPRAPGDPGMGRLVFTGGQGTGSSRLATGAPGPRAGTVAGGTVTLGRAPGCEEGKSRVLGGRGEAGVPASLSPWCPTQCVAGGVASGMENGYMCAQRLGDGWTLQSPQGRSSPHTALTNLQRGGLRGPNAYDLRVPSMG